MNSVAILGFGFMGKTHAEVYRLLAGATVTAIIDPRVDQVRAALAESGCDAPVFPDYESAVGAAEFSIVDVCLPTDLHTPAVLKALSDGKHVFCEKPISLTLEEADQMNSAALAAGKSLMVGHCIRFWPEYVALKEMVESGESGRLLTLSMVRRSGRPANSTGDWVNQPARCVGAALDLHIHDTDFLLHVLGTPDSVFSRGIRDETGWSSIATQYVYDGMAVVAEGAWNYPTDWGFQMRFAAVFENAVLDFDSRSSPTLTLTRQDGVSVPVPLPESAGLARSSGGNIDALSGYLNELAYFLDCVGAGVPVTTSNGRHARESLRVVLAEIESARSGLQVTL